MEQQDQPELIIGRSSVLSYAFTLRKTSTKKGQPTQEDYQVHIDTLCLTTKSYKKEVVFERTGGLHMHGILEVPKRCFMNKFRIRGWKMHLEEIYDYDGWKRYMAKEQVLKNYEKELSEQEHPVHKIRRSLFKTAIPLQLLDSPNGEDTAQDTKHNSQPGQ